MLKYLRRARLRAGLTQTGLSAKLRRPQSFVSKYERGRQVLDVIEFSEIADALGIDGCLAICILQDERMRP